MKNLENYGVLEMDAAEIEKTDGGIIFCLVFGVSLGCMLVSAMLIPTKAY